MKSATNVLLVWQLNINQISILLQLWLKFVSTKSFCMTRSIKFIQNGNSASKKKYFTRTSYLMKNPDIFVLYFFFQASERAES